MPKLKCKRAARPSVFLLLLSCLSLSCGAEGSPEGITPIKAEYVLSVFELQSPSSGPCSALMGVPSDYLGDDGWAISFPEESQLLSVMECLGTDEAVLYESTGHIMGWGVSQAGWDLFSSRSLRGAGQVAVSGHGEMTLNLGERDGERVLFTEMQFRHTSNKFSIDNELLYEGVFPRNTSLLLYRFLSDGDFGPQLCVVLELQE